MKKIIMIVGALLLSAGCLTAQDTATRGYSSFFGSESTEWHVEDMNYDVYGQNYRYLIRGDTIISGMNYKKMEVHRVMATAPQTYFESGIDSSLSGFVREDTIEGKLWVRNGLTENGDDLIVNLSLNIGDTFYYRDNRGFGIYVVHDVFMDSLGRKVIAFNDGYYQFFFIESVGASTFFGRVNLGLYSTVICIFHDDTLTYRNNNLSDIDTGNCWSAYRLGVEGTAKNNIKIYPNPAYNYINIEANDIHNITIFNLQGNTLLSCDNVKKYIDIQSIPRGIVIVRIISDNGIIYKQLVKI
jgi:hypothetical protein